MPKMHRQEELPLKVFTKDAVTMSPFKGYLNKKKNLYYYKARDNGAKVNVSAKGLNKRFSEELKRYQYDKKYQALLKAAIQKQLKEKLNNQHLQVTINKKK